MTSAQGRSQELFYGGAKREHKRVMIFLLKTGPAEAIFKGGKTKLSKGEKWRN